MMPTAKPPERALRTHTHTHTRFSGGFIICSLIPETGKALLYRCVGPTDCTIVIVAVFIGCFFVITVLNDVAPASGDVCLSFVAAGVLLFHSSGAI